MGEIRRICSTLRVWSGRPASWAKWIRVGGGTIAYILSNCSMDVPDVGVPVLAMHAPFEVISKADLYMAAKTYAAFYESR